MTYLKANDTKSKRVIIPLKVAEEDYQGKIPGHVGLLRQTQGRTYVQYCPYSGIETSMMQMSAIPIAFMRGFYAERTVIIVIVRARVERAAEQSNNEPLTILLTPAKWLRGGQNRPTVRKGGGCPPRPPAASPSAYFPMQKAAKISPKSSSGRTVPVMLPKAS